MSQNSLNKTSVDAVAPVGRASFKWSWSLLLLPVWIYMSFQLAQFIVSLLFDGLHLLSVPLASLDESVLNTFVAACVYGLTLLIAIGGPWLVKRAQTTRQDLALTRLPAWMDLLMAPAGLVAYFLLSSMLLLIATHFFPGIENGPPQNTGFAHLNYQYEYVLAFLTLVVIAPLAEEILFRGYLLGKLLKVVPVWVAIVATSLLFGFIHGSWNIGIDTFALSILLSLLRVTTGSLWASVLLHMMKNGIAFYILFINPTIFSTLGG